MFRFGLCSLIVCLAVLPAGAAELGKDELVRQLTPRSAALTRTLVGSPGPAGGLTRQIVVEPGREEQVLAEIGTLPSVNIRVLFDYNSDVLKPEGVATLKPLGEALQDPKLQGFRFLIGGHTDARGSEEYNKLLSERRARSVREHLITTYGIAPERTVSLGFGERQLADPANPESGVNRRVEVVNLIK